MHPQVIKSRIQSATTGTYSGFLDCARKTIATDGVGALWRGLGPAMARAFPANAAAFVRPITWITSFFLPDTPSLLARCGIGEELLRQVLLGSGVAIHYTNRHSRTIRPCGWSKNMYNQSSSMQSARQHEAQVGRLEAWWVWDCDEVESDIMRACARKLKLNTRVESSIAHSPSPSR